MKSELKEYDNIDVDDAQFISDIKAIVYTAKQKAYQAADLYQVVSNWLVGRRIVEQEQHGQERAQYGKHIVELASEALTAEFGKGYSVVNIKSFRKFYLTFNNLLIGQTVSDQSENGLTIKGQSVSAELELAKILPSNLSWSHYERLMRIKNEDERDWYMREAAGESWSVRTLNRNIGSQYYHRLLQTPESKRGEVIHEMQRLTTDYQKDRHKFLRNPVVAEFLGFSQDAAYSETNLESAIIDHLQKFILELGKEFAFVARQQRIKTDMGDYYIDLVFYNYILKCFLLIDLKSSQISYEDVGQMDMYIRMYDELKCSEGDNPTIGLLLCSETSKDLARYSILKDSKQLYAAKYLTYLPTKEQLTAEIERQKEIFALQTGKYQD
ncbi:YhcG family protein [uncultured Duncaniella sp.]|jgi:predicted nuclease of restriction endonuclease-like (RecB) superfamily|uniref:PDDEXK nuclease domain-containing protein n=1 Tax=uncultured Duncaniella sp. TaxID=2768039 RepID=UPI0025A53908|nr:PDDEXK nuclease domain-containing protein [uncultured Duncaniella sp.]